MGKIEKQLAPVLRDVVLNSGINGRIVPRRLRAPLWRMVGHEIHPSVTISPGTFLGATKGLSVGQGSFINYGCFIDLGAKTTLGSNVALGYGVMLITCSHHLASADGRAGVPTQAPITIGDGAWLGARVTVLPGVSIGEGCVIAAGAVVADDCKPNTLYGGVPAREIRRLTHEEAQEPIRA